MKVLGFNGLMCIENFKNFEQTFLQLLEKQNVLIIISGVWAKQAIKTVKANFNEFSNKKKSIFDHCTSSFKGSYGADLRHKI